MPEQYWLISYTWRAKGDAHWHWCNCVHSGSLPDWITKQQKYKSEEYILVNAFSITLQQYENLEGQL